MKLIISSFNYIAIYDLDKGIESILDEGRGKYFGVSWGDGTLYTTVGVRPKIAERYGKKIEKIMCFNKELKFQSFLFDNGFGLKDVHQILCKDGFLWIVNSGRNRIDKFDFKSRKATSWYPLFFRRYRDFNHLNSISIDGDKLYLLAHNNKRPSQIFIYTYPGLQLLKKIILGKQAHNIYAEGSELFICDSLLSGNLISTKGNFLHIEKGYIRGLAVSKKLILVGSSNKASRYEREKGDCELYIFNRQTRKLESIDIIKGAGNIYEIRILDEWDYAHNIDPFF
jgi:hypothetical protein